MSLLLVVAALVVVVVVAFFVVGAEQRMPDEPHDRVPADLPENRPIARTDVDRLRFATEFRGYRMDQVDAVLDRVAESLDDQRARNDALTEQLLAAGIEPVVTPASLAPDSEGALTADDDHERPDDAQAEAAPRDA